MTDSDYVKMKLTVTEIRERSIFVKAPRLGSSGEVSMGRSVMHAASDDRIAKYNSELPMEMVLTVRQWWADKYERDYA